MTEERRARVVIVERARRPLPEPELAAVMEPADTSRAFGFDVRFTIDRTYEGGFEAHATHGVLVHNGVRASIAALRDGDRIEAGDLVFRFDIEDAGPLDDVVVVGGEVLAWRVAGDNVILRAVRVRAGYDTPLEVVRLFAGFREDVARYEVLGALAAKRVALAVGTPARARSGTGDAAFLVRHSTRGARADAIVARPDGTVDDALALLFARALVEARERASEVVRLESLALTFEGDIVVAALDDPRGPRRSSLVHELGRLGQPATEQAQRGLQVATSLAMSDQESTSLSALDVLDEAMKGFEVPDRASRGTMVKHLFPDAWRAEERWREEVALLDEEQRRRLVLEPRSR